MPWKIEKISNNRDRIAQAVRDELENARQADKETGRGYGATASAVESALQAFGDINGHQVEIKTCGDIKAGGEGYLTITIRTIGQDVIV